jgi:hypothetical protein
MKQRKKILIRLLPIIFACASVPDISAQDSVTAEPSLKLQYFAVNNSSQYLIAESRLKTGNKFQALPRQVVNLYMDSVGSGNLVMTGTTDKKGKAKFTIPPALKGVWMGNGTHKFIGILEASAGKEEITEILEITKSRITIDTINEDGVRNIRVQVMYADKDDWIPAKEVEMKLGVKRSTGILPAGENSYTTDSTGTIVAPFTRDSLPGDEHGNFVLAAKVEDNELYGNLLIEKTVQWGVIVKPETGFFDQRTLWSTRFKTPPWLLIMAYAIITGVWSTLIYLAVQIFRIKKLGKQD